MRYGLCRRLALVGVVLFAPAVALGQPVVDGQNIATEFVAGGGALLATQRFETGFGNDTSGNQFGFGSELDQMFAANDDQFLYIGLTGNLENNGNCIVVFVDVNGPGSGANQLRTQVAGNPFPGGLPRYLQGEPTFTENGLDRLRFDPGFAPDYVLGWSGGSPLGSQTRTYYLVNFTTLDSVSGGFGHSNTIAGLMTSGDPTASGATPGTLGDFLATGTTGILGASDNSNTAGVEGASPPDFIPMVTASAPTAATGFEFGVPLSLLGLEVDDEVCLFAMVSSTGGFMSNQILPTDPNATTFPNLGTTPLGFDDPNNPIAGDQFACYTIQAAPGCPLPGCERADIDPAGGGDCDVDLTDLAVLLSNFGITSGATRDQGDIDPAAGDGDVDLTDLALMLSDFGAVCQ